MLEPGQDDLRPQRPAEFLFDRARLGISRVRAAPRLPGASLGGAGADPLFRLADAPLFADDPLEGDELLSRRRQAEQGNSVAGGDGPAFDRFDRGLRQDEAGDVGGGRPPLAAPPLGGSLPPAAEAAQP